MKSRRKDRSLRSRLYKWLYPRAPILSRDRRERFLEFFSNVTLRERAAQIGEKAYERLTDGD